MFLSLQVSLPNEEINLLSGHKQNKQNREPWVWPSLRRQRLSNYALEIYAFRKTVNFLAAHKFHMYVGKALNVFDLLRNRCSPSKTRPAIVSWEKYKCKKNLKANECQCWQENLPGLICSYSWVTTSNFWIHTISSVKGTKLEISVSDFAFAYWFHALFERHRIQKLMDELQRYKINMFKSFIHIQVIPICLWPQSKVYFSN